jgi:hypothetical protein
VVFVRGGHQTRPCRCWRASSALRNRRILSTCRVATAAMYLLRTLGSHIAHPMRVAAARRCLPASVFGPVHIPPWLRRRPFLIAFAMHGPPLRVFAPHLRLCHQRPAITLHSAPKPMTRAQAALLTAPDTP